MVNQKISRVNPSAGSSLRLLPKRNQLDLPTGVGSFVQATEISSPTGGGLGQGKTLYRLPVLRLLQPTGRSALLKPLRRLSLPITATNLSSPQGLSPIEG